MAASIELTPRETSRGTLRIAYTPDSDDAFNFYAWEHGRVGLEGWAATFARDHIIALNRAAEQDRFDLVAVSSVRYPALADRYWILSVGNSIGRGYGPVLASKRFQRLEELKGRRIAVAGIPTTGAALAAMYCPDCAFVEMPYDRIADAVVDGACDAGVMIHEELLFFPQKGLSRVADLGAVWTGETGLPLPVGLNIVSRRVGRKTAAAIAETCRRSLQWAMDHREEAMEFASQFGRGCCSRHVEMFSNADTLRLTPDVRTAMQLMFERVAKLGIGPRIDAFEVIE